MAFFLVHIAWTRAIWLSMTVQYLCDFQSRCMWAQLWVPIRMVADAFTFRPLHILIAWVVGPELGACLFLGHAWTRAAIHSLVPKECLEIREGRSYGETREAVWIPSEIVDHGIHYLLMAVALPVRILTMFDITSNAKYTWQNYSQHSEAPIPPDRSHRPGKRAAA